MKARTAAVAMMSYKGIAFCKKYLAPTEEPGKLALCDNGHASCAHYKNGPCRDELEYLIHNTGKAAA